MQYASYCSLRSQQLGQNPFQITYGDGILPCMSRDFAIIHGKTPRGILPVNSNVCYTYIKISGAKPEAAIPANKEDIIRV